VVRELRRIRLVGEKVKALFVEISYPWMDG